MAASSHPHCALLPAWRCQRNICGSTNPLLQARVDFEPCDMERLMTMVIAASGCCAAGEWKRGGMVAAVQLPAPAPPPLPCSIPWIERFIQMDIEFSYYNLTLRELVEAGKDIQVRTAWPARIWVI